MVNLKEKSSRERVEEYLHDKLRLCEPGDRLPSIRQIKQDCGVSQSVVDKVIMQLLVDEQIKVKRPSGLFKAVPPVPKIKVLNFKSHMSGSFYHFMLTETFYVMASRNRQVEIIPINDPAEISEHISESNNTTYVTFSMSLRDYPAVSHLNKVVHLLPDFAEEVSPSLCIDDAQLMQAQLEYLVSKGHRRIAYFHIYDENNYSRAQNVRWDTFHRLGFAMKLDFNEQYLVGFSGKNGQEKVDAIKSLMKMQNPPTAFLMAGDDMVYSVYNGLMQAGLEPGKDIPVLGTNNLEWCKYTSPQLSSIGFDVPAGLEAMLDMIEEIELGGEGRAIKFPLRTGIRESC